MSRLTKQIKFTQTSIRNCEGHQSKNKQKNQSQNLRVKKTQYFAQTCVSSSIAASIDIFQGFPKRIPTNPKVPENEGRS